MGCGSATWLKNHLGSAQRFGTRCQSPSSPQKRPTKFCGMMVLVCPVSHPSFQRRAVVTEIERRKLDRREAARDTTLWRIDQVCELVESGILLVLCLSGFGAEGLVLQASLVLLEIAPSCTLAGRGNQDQARLGGIRSLNAGASQLQRTRFFVAARRLCQSCYVM